MADNNEFSRRSVLVGTATGLTAAVAGCSGSSDDDYEEGNGGDSGNGGDNGGDNSSSGDEETASITEHEMTTTETDYGTTELVVEGTVKNNTDELIDYVEVSVRAYNDDDQQIDTYMANTTELGGGKEWPFEVSLYDVEESDVADYDIAIEANQY
ncbi:FxLYD domain-containing protein [Natrialba taiwanensis]|nr:FxLYD domain-containing protein [Natrialba taiwanensis]